MYIFKGTCPARVSSYIDFECKYKGAVVDCSDRSKLLEGTTLKMSCKPYYHLTHQNQKRDGTCEGSSWDTHYLDCEAGQDKLQVTYNINYNFNIFLNDTKAVETFVNLFKSNINNVKQIENETTPVTINPTTLSPAYDPYYNYDDNDNLV